jgi:hypothetical protein
MQSRFEGKYAIKKLKAGVTTLDEALNATQVKLYRDINNLEKFVSVLYTGLKQPGQAIDGTVG